MSGCSIKSVHFQRQSKTPLSWINGIKIFDLWWNKYWEMENWKMHITGNLRKHPHLLALRRWGRFAPNVPSGEARGETGVFAGYVYHRRQADSVKLAGIGLVCNVWADSILICLPLSMFLIRHLQALPYPRRCTHESREQHSRREWGESCVCFPNTLCCVLVFGLF